MPRPGLGLTVLVQLDQSPVIAVTPAAVWFRRPVLLFRPASTSTASTSSDVPEPRSTRRLPRPAYRLRLGRSSEIELPLAPSKPRAREKLPRPETAEGHRGRRSSAPRRPVRRTCRRTRSRSPPPPTTARVRGGDPVQNRVRVTDAANTEWKDRGPHRSGAGRDQNAFTSQADRVAAIGRVDGDGVGASHDPFAKYSRTTAVTATLATAIGNSPFQPKLMSWS